MNEPEWALIEPLIFRGSSSSLLLRWVLLLEGLGQLTAFFLFLACHLVWSSLCLTLARISIVRLWPDVAICSLIFFMQLLGRIFWVRLPLILFLGRGAGVIFLLWCRHIFTRVHIYEVFFRLFVDLVTFLLIVSWLWGLVFLRRIFASELRNDLIQILVG